ncbi:MAG: glycosyltransferase family 2 protein, partial [Gemmatimonadota bacterium]
MIFFCIPVHNEEKTAGVVLWKVRQVMAEFPRDYQILLADDASTDGTGNVIDPYRRVLPLILMRSHRRRGYAAALEMLVREAARRSRYPRRDIVIVMQADFSEDADQIPALLRRMESGADLVVGGPVSSAVRPGLVERGTNRIVRNLLHRKTWPEPVSDPLVGFSAVRLACIRRALEEATGRLLQWDGPTANAALLDAVAPHARRIDAVEMTFHPERRQRPRRSSPV